MSRPVRVTHQSMEKHIKDQCNLDGRRREMRDYANENAKLISVAGMQSRVDVLRRQAEQQACQNEQRYIDDLNQERSRRRAVERTGYQNEALTSELNREADAEHRRALEIQRICDDSEELRDLERTLKAAYMNQERAAQSDNRALRSAREQEKIDEMDEQMENNRLRAIQDDEERDGARRVKHIEQRFVLQDQMREKERQIIESRKQLITERNMVDDIVHRINQEDDDDYRRRKDVQAATARMIRETEEQRRREVAAARKAAIDEEERIIAYNKTVAARSEGLSAKRQAKNNEEQRILQRMIDDSAAKRREEEEFSDLRDMLYEEELEEKRRIEQLEKRDRQSEMRRGMMDANNHLLASKAEKRQMEMENEARIVSDMRRKFAEDDARERYEAEQRRLNKLDQLSSLERQKMDKRQMHDEEIVREQEIAAEESRKEEYKRRVIQEARKRLLDEHASRLQGYLPGKVFNDTDEHDRYQQNSSRQPSRGYSR